MRCRVEGGSIHIIRWWRRKPDWKPDMKYKITWNFKRPVLCIFPVSSSDGGGLVVCPGRVTILSPSRGQERYVGQGYKHLSWQCLMCLTFVRLHLITLIVFLKGFLKFNLDLGSLPVTVSILLILKLSEAPRGASRHQISAAEERWLVRSGLCVHTKSWDFKGFPHKCNGGWPHLENNYIDIVGLKKYNNSSMMVKE